jgi:hypothetical protein
MNPEAVMRTPRTDLDTNFIHIHTPTGISSAGTGTGKLLRHA